MQRLNATDLIIPLWNHGNGERNFVFQFINCSTRGVLVQRKNLFFQLVNAFLQQKQFAGIQVDLHNATTHRRTRLSNK